jgi:hypothetical protein
MQPKPGFDDVFKMKYERRWWPIRSIWRLMLVVAASALTMAILAGTFRPGIRPKYGISRTQIAVVKPPVLTIASQTTDPLVIVADTSIDPKMVVPAPLDIDPKMVVRAPLDIDERMVLNPESSGRLPSLTPRPQSTPVPDGVSPYFSTPQPR